MIFRNKDSFAREIQQEKTLTIFLFFILFIQTNREFPYLVERDWRKSASLIFFLIRVPLDTCCSPSKVACNVEVTVYLYLYSQCEYNFIFTLCTVMEGKLLLLLYINVYIKHKCIIWLGRLGWKKDNVSLW